MPMAQSAVSWMTLAVASMVSMVSRVASPVEDLTQQRRELAQAHPAGDALAAGLGMA